MKHPKLHHHLAQTIQRQFSEDGKTICRYNKLTKEWDKVGIRGNAAITDHNTIYRKGTKNTQLEGVLAAEIDSPYLDLVQHLKDTKPLADKRDYIQNLFAFTFSRSPKQRRNMERISKEMRSILDINVDDKKELQNHTILGSLVETDVYYRVISNSWFWVAKTFGPTIFFTSDNPCASAGMPITPHYAIMSSSSDERKDLEYLPVDADIVRMMNQIVFDDTEQYVYAKFPLDMKPYGNGEYRTLLFEDGYIQDG